MKPNAKNAWRSHPSPQTNLLRAQNPGSQLRRVRATIEDALSTSEPDERLVRLALNEAEALAWQTPFPHLFFPILAQEKVESLAKWQARQQELRPDDESASSFAA